MFSPLFGAILHLKNWEAMGEPAKAAQNKKWIVASLVLLAASLGLDLTLPESGAIDAIQRAVGFGLLIGWYHHIGKSQQATILARYGKGYPRKGWGKPLLLALLAVVGLVVVAGLVGFVAAVVVGAK